MGTPETEELAPGQDPEGPPAPASFPSFLLALFDEVNVRILQATVENYLSVKDIAKATELPIRACYRRVKALHREGLLRLDQADPEGRGRPSTRYKSSLGDVKVVLTGNEYSVSLVWPEVSFNLSVDFS
ncbi:MAG: winged helix-turn-helix domain-containing protein [Thermoplasmata archaeon]